MALGAPGGAARLCFAVLTLLGVLAGAAPAHASESPTKSHAAFLAVDAAQDVDLRGPPSTPGSLSEVAESGEHYGSAAVEKAVDAARLVAGKAASLVQAGKAAAAGTVGTKDLLGTTLQLGIVILLVLVGLFFYWGGSVQELEDHPRDSLMSTASRAKGEYNEWNTRNSVGGGGSNLPSQRDLAANDPFATKPNPRKKNACVC